MSVATAEGGGDAGRGEEWGKGGMFVLKTSHVMVRHASDASGCVKVRCRRRRGMEGVNNTLYQKQMSPIWRQKSP